MTDLTNPNYQPGNLFDRAGEKLGTKSDAQLARQIGTSAPRVSRMRNKILPVTGGILIRLNELTGIAIGDLREMAGLPRRMYIAA